MKKVLICDDDSSILEVMKIILEQNDFQVQTSSSGKGIQQRVEEYQPDIVLLDLWMPGMDGKETTKLLKKDPKTKQIPVIIISALNDTDKVARDIGADDHLPKPFNMDDLIAIVKKYTKT